MDQAVAAMKPLLNQGVRLVIVSGTTIENIAGGRIEKYFSEKELDNLYLGLGRGAYNYAFRDGEPFLFHDMLPDAENLEKIHRKEGAGKKRTQAWDSRRTCRVLRRALNEKSFLQVWGPRVQPAEG